MASRADQLATNLNLSKFGQATELKNRLWFTVGVLIVYRLLSFVPLPGVDPTALGLLANQTRGGVVDFFNTFSGGALERMSLIALGVMPYITASIVVQMAAALLPSLGALKKEGESGRKKLNQYTRYGTVLLTAVQGWFIAVGLESFGALQGVAAVVEPGLLFRLTAVISLVGGTMFLMWLGEQITSRGVGNGVSLIIMAGIVAQLPTTISNLFSSTRTGSISIGFLLVIIAAIVGTILFICFMERAQRRVLIQYPKRQTQRGMMQADRSHLPLKINTAGVIPPIFASSLLLMPLTITQFAGQAVEGQSAWGDFVISLNQYLAHGTPVYMTLYAAGIIFFSFFYTAVVFNPEETAENLKRNGGFIPGIRPGKNTMDYLDYVLTRITVIGSIYLAIICLLPEFLLSSAGLTLLFGGTSLLIIVNVTMDTVSQIQSHLIAHQYGDLIKKARLKGGRPR
ncbi:preprotein translocase subunit SecY [Sphingomonas jejuensis]|uniref:Protein translocase subunit SecY n=1 Tax=Sphingomonas jejuensis TaxID=904715 RepID=A0ABX0XI91_9SPHN|nr:preprotein translocase subunit SecY [Sphingomonas jejuensis]NJC32587.1 preprotein translocase subunit SecY [Sphingomonas jejuensis]